MPKTFFNQEFFESLPFSARSQKWIRLSPFAVQMAADQARPLLVLKDKTGVHTLPVPLNALEAGVALTQSNPSIVPSSPHKVTEVLLQTLGLQFSSCVFAEIRGSYQFVRLNMKKHDQGKLETPSLKVRADEAMSFCLHLQIPIYATATFMERSRVLVSEVLENSRSLMAQPEIRDKAQRYIQ